MKPPKLPLPKVPPGKMAGWRAVCADIAKGSLRFSAEIEEHKLETAVVGCWLTWELTKAGCSEEGIETMCIALGQIASAAMDFHSPWDIAQTMLEDWRATGAVPCPGPKLAEALLAQYGTPSELKAMMRDALDDLIRQRRN